MDEISQRTRRVTRPWRSAFVVYALALTVATHWPELTLSPAGPSDKTIHVLAFGLFTLLLWMTRWLKRLTVVFLVGVLWACLDEWSQGIPILDRWVTWQDLAANVLGVTATTAWIWAMRPIGSTGNRMRLRLHWFVIEEIFAQRKAWFVLVGAFVSCAAPLAVIWPFLAPSDRLVPATIAASVWVVVTLLIWSAIWRAHYRGVLLSRNCFACGSPCAGVELDEHGMGRCPRCAAGIHAGMWLEPAPPTTESLVRFAIAPVLTGVGIFFVGYFLIGVAGIAYDRIITAGYGSPWLPRLARIHGTEKELMRCVDLTVLLAVFALCTRMYRRRLARHYDEPFRCRRCGHDLRGTPTSGGAGRCGECGTQFVRPPEARSTAVGAE